MRTRILFVDDEQSIVKVMDKMLTEMGYSVTCVNDSIKALETFRANPYGFDLIITDMTMPGMNGTDLTNNILKINPHSKVIVLTGFSDVHNPGARMRIEKPINAATLDSAIKTVLDMD